MKSLLVIILVIRIFNSMKFKRHNYENFFYLKCVIYLFVSSIHSKFIIVTVPLGAILMGIFSIFDPKNRRLKIQMIFMGLFIVFLSLLTYDGIASPLQKGYLYWTTHNTSRIDLYSYNNDQNSFLFSVTNPPDIENWVEQINASTPVTSWEHKNLGSEMGYILKVYSDKGVTDIFLNPYNNDYANMSIGTNKINYFNPTITSFIDGIYSRAPSMLTINTSKDASINITNPTLLSTLWRTILWNETPIVLESTDNIFNIPAYLFFDKYLGCRISFSDSFQYAHIDKKGILELPTYLQNTLKEQFILSQLDQVNQFTDFEPAHIYTPSSSTQKFSILLDPNGLYHGLYRHDFVTNEMQLLHTVHSSTAQYFILKHPYILVLDEKTPGEPYLMLINQNIPGKHRYISKNQAILSNSLSICPQNQKFAYITNQGEHSSLNLVTDYYRSPQIIASGDIQDCLFLSNDLLVFTQKIDGEQLLCVYDLIHKQVIKYILIPGDIVLTQSKDEKVYFAVQLIDGLTLREAQFFITSDLKLQKIITQ